MRIILSLIIILFASHSWGATLYLNPTGANGEYGNLQAAMTAMSAGDTLIIRDGAYTGATNVINTDHLPPSSSTLWTTFQAEHSGNVVFDGQATRTMFEINAGSQTNRHWIFDGIIWGNSLYGNVTIAGCSYVKFLNCGAFEAGPSANVNQFFIAGYCSYILLEKCYTWGRGRTGMTAWCSGEANRTDHIIFRSCVSRIDRVTDGEPCYNFGMYSVNYGLVQNCIAIDTDQVAYYDNTTESWAGGFATPSTNYQVDNVTVRNSIVVNSKIGGINVSGNNPSNNILFDNMLILDVTNKTDNSVNAPWGVNDVLDHMTIHLSYDGSDAGYLGVNGYGGSGTHTIRNSVLSDLGPFSSGILTYQMACNYTCTYGSTGTTATSTYTNSITADPIWSVGNTNGGLKYPVRIEDDSNLDGVGLSGSDVGANILFLYGEPGTLWGETGYDTITATPMWPYPNEDLIKSKMVEYSGGGVVGARGFCASGTRLDGVNPITLTSYIWEYLGNEIPEDIYGTTPTYDSPTITGPADSPTTSTSVEIEGTYTVDSELTVDTVTWTLGAESGFCVAALGTFTCTVPDLALGANSIVFWVVDSNNGEDEDTTVITRTALKASGIRGAAVVKNATIH